MILTNPDLSARDNFEFLHLMLDHISDYLVAVDTNGIIILINGPYCELLQGTPYDFIGHHIVDVVGPDTKLHLVAQGKTVKIGYPLEVRGHKLVTKQVPVKRGNRIIGAVGLALFSDLDKLKPTYTRVFRRELSIPQNNKQWQSKYRLSDVIGSGQKIDEYRANLYKVAKYDLPVLISGETGTGKELAAHIIHSLSTRSNEPFVWVNCASIPRELIEIELFGYESGAFTGARQRGKPGKFELAENGILFLDEIGDMPLPLQGNLLRALQTGEIVRVGGTFPITLNVRVISATNRSLIDEIRADRFRADLYYRLNVLNINTIPLREYDDILYLANYLIKKIAKKLDRKPPKFSASDRRWIVKHKWPGNIRELENSLARFIVYGNFHHEQFQTNKTERYYSETSPWKRRIQRAGKDEVIDALKRSNGNKKLAARMLGISRSHLYRLIKSNDIGNAV